LLRILLGQLQPQTGTVRLGTNLQIAYFDQLRNQLREEETVAENVGDGNDTIRWAGGSRHIIGYLQDFLFSPDRSRSLVKFLSGGERNRVLLAKLFTKPANVIVLDEPTNDLDAETLELLEERLVEFPGTVLLVSHDREFLNNVVGSTIVFEDGNVKEYVGGYDDWQRTRTARLEAEAAKAKTTSSTFATKAAPSAAPPAKKKLSYKEQKELEGLPAKIEGLEAQIAELHTAMADPQFYKQPADRLATEQAKLKQLEEGLTAAMLRWEELESL
jgi:ATP-binding cassette subfamily F protein uup